MQASIGIATAERGAALDTVLRDSDVAMYAAKQRGKAGYVRYVPGMEEPVLAHIQLGGELRRALDEGEFLIHYQPIIGLQRRPDRRRRGAGPLAAPDPRAGRRRPSSSRPPSAPG